MGSSRTCFCGNRGESKQKEWGPRSCTCILLFLLEHNFGPHPKLAWSFPMGNVWLALLNRYYVVQIQNLRVTIGINPCKEFYKSKLNKVII